MGTQALHVRDIESGEIVRTIDVSAQSERDVERVLSGLLRQMDTDRFVVDEVSA